MSDPDARDRLLDFLERRAFKPILSKSPRDYPSPAERRKLEEVQDATRRDVKRFKSCRSAEGIIDEYRGELSSDAAERVRRELHTLGLPALQDLRDEFRSHARELGYG